MKKLTNLIFPLLIVFLTIFLFFKNYIQGTWLIGWDNTVPELNLEVNFIRQINAVWQEYRGLGLLDGMAHSANLIHTVYVFLLSLIFQASLIRWVFTFFMYFLGGMGVYFLVKRIISVRSVHESENHWVSAVAAFTASLFYLLNPATIQMFYTPFESFTIHFGFLPWLYLVLVNFLQKGGRKWAIILFSVNLLAVSQTHVPAVFIVYAFGFLAICFCSLIGNLRNWKRILIGLFILVGVNTFWATPYIYSAINNASIISNSKVNRLSNEEIILINKNYGDLKSVALLRGFSLDYGDWDRGQEKFDFQLRVWRDHFFTNEAETVGYILLGFSLLGLIYSLFTKKSTFPFFLILLFSFVNLATDTPYVSSVKQFLDLNIPYYKEVFRFTFTKFATIYTLFLSVFLGMGVLLLFKLLKKYLGSLLVLGLLVGIFFLAKPAFSGSFIYDNLRLKIPNEYFEVFAFFNRAEDGRVAILPQPSFWNWEYEKWGYRGSGFIWQGISKPTLHRAFDPWSALNETYYLQLSKAVEEKNVVAFEQILKKYEVKWILFDESIVQPGTMDKERYNNEIKDLTAQSDRIKEVKNFGFLIIYEFTGTDTYGSVWAPQIYKKVSADTTYSAIDPIYTKHGIYVQTDTAISYPFVNFDPRSEIKIKLEEGSGKLVIENKETNSKVILEVKDKITENFANDRGFKEAFNCDLKKIGEVFKGKRDGKNWYRAEGGGVSCDFFDYPDLSYNQGYVLRVKGENITGRSLKIYLHNWQTKRMELEELLPSGNFDNYFVVLPKKAMNDKKLKDNSAYSLNVETRSFGRIASENVIENIEFIPFDIEFLTSLVSLNGEISKEVNDLKLTEFEKLGTSHYFVKTQGQGLLVLGQGYEKGWNAYSIEETKCSVLNGFFCKALPWFFGKRLNHVRVNSWENGWFIGNSGNPIQNSLVAIIFWPQYLEWGGMIILILSFIPIFFSKVQRSA